MSDFNQNILESNSTMMVCPIDSNIKNEIKINEENIKNLKNQLGDLEKNLYGDKVDGKIGIGDSQIDNEYLNNYKEINTSNNFEKLNDLNKKIEFLKLLLETFSQQKYGKDKLDLSDKKYDKVKNKIIGYGNKENFYDLVSDMKKSNDGRYKKFEDLIKQGNSGDAYLLLFMDNKSFSNWEDGFNGIKKINSGIIGEDEKERDYLLFNIHPNTLMDIGKENDLEKVKTYLINLSNKDYFQYNGIYLNSSDDFKKNYLKKYENIDNSFYGYLNGFKGDITDNILKKFHNSKINIFENFNDFKSLYNQILKADNINDFIKTKVFGISNYMSSEILFNVENFITMMESIYGKLFKKGENEIADIEKLRNVYNDQNINNIDKMKSINGIDNFTFDQIKNILKTGDSKNLTEIICKFQDQNNEKTEKTEKSNSSDFNKKINEILKLEGVKKFLGDTPQNEKAEKLIKLLFNSVESSKNEVIDGINNVLNKENNKELKKKLINEGDSYIIKHGDTKKDIFDTDRVIREVNDDFYKEELKSKEQGINPKTKLQVLDEKLKAIGLDKLSKEDFNSIRNQFKILLDLEDDKETLKELDKKIKENPDLARVLISGTDEERRKLFKEVEDAKQDNLDKKNIDKTNQESIKSDLQKNNPNTIINDLLNGGAQIKVGNTEFDLDAKELSIIGNDSEKLSKFVDFKSSLDEMGIGFIWKDRNILFQNIETKNSGNSINMLDNDVIGEQEFINILDYIAGEILPEKKDDFKSYKLEDFKKTFKEIKNNTKDKNTNSGIDYNNALKTIFKEKGLFEEGTFTLKRKI